MREEAKRWAETMFDELNDAHFNGTLKRPAIAFFNRYCDPITKLPKYAGYTHNVTPPVSMLMLTDEVLREGRDVAADSILHEMIHHAQATMDQVDYQNHGPSFVAIANRIATQLGLGPVEPETEGAICWPQSLRRNKRN